MGGKEPSSARGGEGRRRDDVPGVHAETQDVAAGQSRGAGQRKEAMTRAHIAAAAALSVVVGLRGGAQQRPAGTSAPDTDVHVLPVQQNVYMLAGPGVNSAVQVGDEGIVLVDTMNAAAADKLVAAIRTLSPKPIIQIIN